MEKFIVYALPPVVNFRPIVSEEDKQKMKGPMNPKPVIRPEPKYPINNAS